MQQCTFIGQTRFETGSFDLTNPVGCLEPLGEQFLFLRGHGVA